MPDRSVNVTIALPLADELHDTIRTTDRRLNVTALTRAQRRVYRDGRPRALRSQQERIWRPYWPDELEEKTVGVLGMGAIGARVVELAKALGMRVLAMRRSVERRTTGAQAGFPAADEMLPPSELRHL